MSSEAHEGGGGHDGGHSAPLRNDLPPKPAPWRPQYTPFVNDYVERHIDWKVTKREPLGQPTEENRRIAEALAARMRTSRQSRKQAH